MASLQVTSVSVESLGTLKRGGWNGGDRVVISGRGFTPHDNEVFCTDGVAEDFLLLASSSDGIEISFLLPDGFSAPFGTGIMIKNANGVASTIPAGERRNF